MNPFKVKITNSESGNTTEVPIVEVVPTKGRGAGKPKLYPENFDALGLDFWIDAFGKKNFYNLIVKPSLKQKLNGFSSEAMTKSSGEVETDERVIVDDFSEMFKTLSKRGDTIASLKDRLEEITNSDDGELLAAIMAGNNDLAKELADEVKQLNRAIAEKRSAPKAAAPAVA